MIEKLIMENNWICLCLDYKFAYNIFRIKLNCKGHRRSCIVGTITLFIYLLFTTNFSLDFSNALLGHWEKVHPTTFITYG